MHKIKLPSHDGSNNYIEQISKNQWMLVPQYNWVREIWDGEKDGVHNIIAVDPSGGPMLSLGDNIYGLVIESFEYSDEKRHYVLNTSGEYKKN